MNNSKRSTNLGSSGFFFVSGEISTGWPYRNVGWINVSSTYFSKNRLIMWPSVFSCSATSILCSSANFRASSTVIVLKSIPVFSLIASVILIFFHSPAIFISFPFHMNVSLWKMSLAIVLNMLSVISIIPSKFEYARYASIRVNSGLCIGSMPSFLNVLPISYTASMPPTNSLFRGSSSAILKYMSRSWVLWCVMKGLADAPVSNVFKIGVSTSVNPRLSMKFWIHLIILGLRNATLLDSSFIIKSTYLLRYLSSMSVNPWNFSGSGLKAFTKWVYSKHLIVISPVIVFITLPLTPTISPMSALLNKVYASSPMSLIEI